MQTHLAIRTLSGTAKPDRQVQALFSTNPNRKAIIFIHGFTGDAIRTWSDFHELLPSHPKCSQTDLFFYGYDGLRAELHASAGILRGFLDRLAGDPAALLAANLPPSAQRPRDFSYTDVVLVAHSLGAVICRRALLDATKNKVSWVSKIKLVLYAPAHMGATAADLAVEAMGSFGFLKLFGIGMRFSSPLIDELKPGSVVLSQLLQDTLAATQGGSNPHLIAQRVIIAEYEKVVKNLSFASDPPGIPIPDTDHMTVCKPSKLRLQPLELLEQCL